MPTRLTFALLATLLGSTAAIAGPFADGGDRQLRQDVDLLKADGLIRGPVDSWPLPWVQINGGLDAARDGRKLDPYIDAAVRRLERLSDLAAQQTSVDARIDATSGTAVARDFGDAARANVDASVRGELNFGALSVDAGVGARSYRSGQRLNFEPSQVVVTIGNFGLYGGYTETWFGPGHDGALLYSNSARPFPRIGIKKLMPTAIDLPVVRWLGPIRLDFFVGILDGKRDFRTSANIGTRISFQPAKGLEIGLNRAQQLCGQGRPCGFHQISQSFIGFGNSDNPTSGRQDDYVRQPGNQIAGYDVSYTRRFGRIAAKFYFEVEAEDAQHILIEQYGRQIGTTLSGPWGHRGASWQAYVEYADTFAAQLFNGTPLSKAFASEFKYPGSLYNNNLYLDGFTYKGRPIGYWTDGDSHNLVGSLSVTDTRNRRWYASVRSVHLNITGISGVATGPYGLYSGTIGNRISPDPEKFGIGTVGSEWPTRFGDVRIEARYQTDSPGTPGQRVGRAQIEVGLRQRF
ncbi:MAG: capsule assembly Wzi family protein [Janthinobacterium lividum]